MHQAIFHWPNKNFYKGSIKTETPTSIIRGSPFEPYTVYQVNTIEDNEVDFMRRLLEFCTKIISPRNCSYGIVCGNPHSKNELEALIA